MGPQHQDTGTVYPFVECFKLYVATTQSTVLFTSKEEHMPYSGTLLILLTILGSLLSVGIVNAQTYGSRLITPEERAVGFSLRRR